MMSKEVFRLELFEWNMGKEAVESLHWPCQCEGLTAEEIWERFRCYVSPEWMVEVEDDGELTELSDIIAQGLKANGYQGLQNDKCGCGVDDLFPYGADCVSVNECKPAYAYECHRCKKRDEGCPVGGMDMYGEHMDILHSTSKEFCSPEYMEVES